MSDRIMRALYIIVNAGFAEYAVELACSKGAAGATIINARGIGAHHKEILGISTDSEKEIILTVTDDETANRIIEAAKENKKFWADAHGLCFALPVTRVVGGGSDISGTAPSE